MMKWTSEGTSKRDTIRQSGTLIVYEKSSVCSEDWQTLDTRVCSQCVTGSGLFDEDNVDKVIAFPEQ